MRKGQILDKAGKRVGRLLVIGFSHMRGRASMWRCRCDCGNEVIVRGGNLTSRHTRSCGCLEDETRKRRHREMVTHGETGGAEYRIWTHMIGRCGNPTDRSFHCYGGRGIKVCERWKTFPNFLADMGRRPSSDLSLDRIDVNGDYTPENCRWATSLQQGRNTRRTIRVEWEGRTIALTELCEQLGLTFQTVYHRVKRGFPIDQALSPVDFRITPRN